MKKLRRVGILVAVVMLVVVVVYLFEKNTDCLLYTSPSPRD